MRLIYCSPVSWSSFSQRPHFMVRHLLSNLVDEVLWVDRYPARLPRITDWNRLKNKYTFSSKSNPKIRVVKLPTLPIEPLPVINKINPSLLWKDNLKNIIEYSMEEECILGIGRSSYLSNILLEKASYKLSFLDVMDDFPEFYHGISKWSMEKSLVKTLTTVDKIIVSSTFLEKKMLKFKKPLLKIVNAYDESILSSNSSKEDRNNTQVILGYVGTIDHWFDWEVLIRLAEYGDKVILVGHLLTKVPKNLPANIEILPPCDHELISNYLSQFTAGIIPFKNNKLTNSVDPIKYYEYRAIGLPVISTKFGEMVYRNTDDGVYFVEDYSDISKLMSYVNQHVVNKESQESWRKENTWQKRFGSGELKQFLGGLY